MTDFPSYKTIAVDKLIPYARNARTHSDDQVAQIAASIKEFGFLNPIIIDGESGIIAGHGRVLAAHKLGLKKLPCIEAAHLTDAQRRAYILADNKLALNAGWDEDMLRIELDALGADGFDLTLTGFSLDEIADLTFVEQEGLTDEDAVPELPESPVSALGDIWLLGDHRVMCGDSTDAGSVALLMDGVKPNLMVTDPPYGVEYDANWRNEADRANGKPYGARAVGKVSNDERADWREAWALFPGNIAYVWHAGVHAGTVAESLGACDFKIRSQLIWAKNNLAISRGDYHWRHEPCWYAVKNKGDWHGDRKQTTLWQIDKPLKSETGHSTQKPVECMRRPIVNNSSIGHAVYDPFLGSGTTVIAAETEGRLCVGMELNPVYIDVIIKRWQDYTGREALLDASQKTFAEVASDREKKNKTAA